MEFFTGLCGSLTLQRHLSVLTKSTHVESRFCGRSRQVKAALCTPVNPCVRSVCSRSVVVGLFDIETFHPDIEIETLSIQVDHMHLVIVIPPKYAVSEIVGKIKANTSREIRQRFPWIKKVYWRNEFWSVGFFSSTVGVNEDVIKRYVEFQEKVDTGKAQLDFGF